MKYIGKPYCRVDGKEKINGEAKYVDDYYLKEMLQISVLRSNIPYGKIKDLDFSEAFIEGVAGIYSAKDFEGDNSYGFPVCDNSILCKDEVRYVGDAIAIVCAENKEIGSRALKLIKIQYEEYEPVLKAGNSDKLLHKLVLKKNVNENVDENCNEISSELVSVDLNMSTKHQEHMYIEVEGAVASFLEGELQIFAPMQSPLVARDIMAKIMKLPKDKVHVIQSTVGGGFGGKDDVVYEACGFAALGAFKTKRPCKYVATREESVISSYKRHPMETKIHITSSREGELRDIKIRTIMDGGAYASVSNFVQFRNTVHAAGPYVFNKVDVENEVYYTNNVYCGAFRGFGGLQACFFYDTAIDELAYKLNMDPLNLRLKNIWKKGERTATNQLINFDPSMEYILNRMKIISNWEVKREEFKAFNESSKYLKKGIGISLGYHGISLGAEGEDFAKSEVYYDKLKEKFVVTSGISEIGQGSRTVFSQIASEVLDLPPEMIEVINNDTDKVLNCGPTVASRGTTVGGRAVQIACDNFKKMIRNKVANYYEVNEEDIGYEDGMFYLKGVAIIKLIKFCNILSNVMEIKTIGEFEMPKIDWKEDDGLGTPYVSYHYGSHVSYITVDIITGEIKIDKYFAIHDIGRVLNLNCLNGQIYGGIATGLGYSLMEDLEIHKGIIGCTNFDSYLIPTSMDMPEVINEWVESMDTLGPFGAKGTGEPVLTPVPACIGNAIRFAIGRRITDLPFSLEKITIGKELSKYGK